MHYVSLTEMDMLSQISNPNHTLRTRKFQAAAKIQAPCHTKQWQQATGGREWGHKSVRAQWPDLAENDRSGEAGALHGPAVRLLVRRRVEAGAHVQRHEEPAGGDPGSARVLLHGADGRLAGAAAGCHHDEHGDAEAAFKLSAGTLVELRFYASYFFQRKKLHIVSV